MFESFYQRSIYLNCLKDNTPRPTSANTVQGNPALGARVGFTASEAITQISRPGKQPAEDPSIAVIKNILKYVILKEIVHSEIFKLNIAID